MPDSLLETSTPLRRDFFEGHKDLLERLAREGQQPQMLFVGCSDSRIQPTTLFGARPGDIFSLRVVANVVPPFVRRDDAVAAVIEYAVLHLKVPHLVICGHTDCGGIKALDAQLNWAAEPALTAWIEHIRPIQRRLDATETLPAAERHRRLVEATVVQQLHNVQTYPCVLEALEANQMELHGWVYYLEEQRMAYYNVERGRFEAIAS